MVGIQGKDSERYHGRIKINEDQRAFVITISRMRSNFKRAKSCDKPLSVREQEDELREGKHLAPSGALESTGLWHWMACEAKFRLSFSENRGGRFLASEGDYDWFRSLFGDDAHVFDSGSLMRKTFRNTDGKYFYFDSSAASGEWNMSMEEGVCKKMPTP